MTYFATFDAEHRHPSTKEPMEGYYVQIEALDEESARFALFGLFSDSWKYLFTSSEFSKSTCPKGEYGSCHVATDFNPKHKIIV